MQAHKNNQKEFILQWTTRRSFHSLQLPITRSSINLKLPTLKTKITNHYPETHFTATQRNILCAFAFERKPFPSLQVILLSRGKHLVLYNWKWPRSCVIKRKKRPTPCVRFWSDKSHIKPRTRCDSVIESREGRLSFSVCNLWSELRRSRRAREKRSRVEGAEASCDSRVINWDANVARAKMAIYCAVRSWFRQ